MLIVVIASVVAGVLVSGRPTSAVCPVVTVPTVVQQQPATATIYTPVYLELQMDGVHTAAAIDYPVVNVTNALAAALALSTAAITSGVATATGVSSRHALAATDLACQLPILHAVWGSAVSGMDQLLYYNTAPSLTSASSPPQLPSSTSLSLSSPSLGPSSQSSTPWPVSTGDTFRVEPTITALRFTASVNCTALDVANIIIASLRTSSSGQSNGITNTSGSRSSVAEIVRQELKPTAPFSDCTSRLAALETAIHGRVEFAELPSSTPRPSATSTSLPVASTSALATASSSSSPLSSTSAVASTTAEATISDGSTASAAGTVSLSPPFTAAASSSASTSATASVTASSSATASGSSSYSPSTSTSVTASGSGTASGSLQPSGTSAASTSALPTASASSTASPSATSSSLSSPSPSSSTSGSASGTASTSASATTSSSATGTASGSGSTQASTSSRATTSSVPTASSLPTISAVATMSASGSSQPSTSASPTRSATPTASSSGGPLVSRLLMSMGIVNTLGTGDYKLMTYKVGDTSGLPSILKEWSPGWGGSAVGGWPQEFIQLGYTGKVLFTAVTANEGRELWITDGSAAGAVMVKDIYSGSSSAFGTGTGTSAAIGSDADTAAFTYCGGLVYFRAVGCSGCNRQVWVTDGTAANTLVLDAQPAFNAAANIHCLNGNNAVFSHYDPSGAWTNISITTGVTLTSTALLRQSNGDGPYSVTNCFSGVVDPTGSTLYFAGCTTTYQCELWKTDGTAAGTTLLKDMNQDATGHSSLPRFFRWVGTTGYFVFAARATGTSVWNLYLSDGTTSGTREVAMSYPSSSGDILGIFPSVGNNIVYVRSWSSSSTNNLWGYRPGTGGYGPADLSCGGLTSGSCSTSYRPYDVAMPGQSGNSMGFVCNGKLYYSGRLRTLWVTTADSTSASATRLTSSSGSVQTLLGCIDNTAFVAGTGGSMWAAYRSSGTDFTFTGWLYNTKDLYAEYWMGMGADRMAAANVLTRY